jgi:thioredoxin-like negative regulator of GroEL
LNIPLNKLTGGHCKNFEQDYIKIASHLKDFVKVGVVNAAEESTLAKHLDVAGFPTIFLFSYVLYLCT